MVSPAPSLRLARKRRLLERQFPWFFLAFFAALGLAGFVLLLDGGRLAGIEGLEPIVRGYTPVGVLLGLGAVLLSFLTFVYAFRKRGLQERLPLSSYRRPLLGTGVCGGLTTFSTMQVEIVKMLDGRHIGLALGYAAASMACGYAAVQIATATVRRVRVRA